MYKWAVFKVRLRVDSVHFRGSFLCGQFVFIVCLGGIAYLRQEAKGSSKIAVGSTNEESEESEENEESEE